MMPRKPEGLKFGLALSTPLPCGQVGGGGSAMQAQGLLSSTD